MAGQKHLFCLGMGYSARVFARRCLEQGWRVTGTSRGAEGLIQVNEVGAAGVSFDGHRVTPDLLEALQSATHLLISAGPDDHGDPVLRVCSAAIEKLRFVEWIGYLSTVGVYGDHGGEWVDEETSVRPRSQRSLRRVAAEAAWLEFAEGKAWSLQIFRLAGIYGPGRSAVEKLTDS